MEFHHYILATSYRAIKLIRGIGRHLKVIPNNELRVLLYHDIAPSDQQRFADQLKWLKQSWTFISPEKFSSIVDGREHLVGRNLLLTFDDGFASNRVIAEQVLKPLDITALFFVITDFVSIEDPAEARSFISKHIYPGVKSEHLPPHWVNMGWNDLAALVRLGHSIGSHTKTHARLSQLTDEELGDQIVGSANEISVRLGTKVDHFAYTFGDLASFSRRAMSIARQRYKYIYSGLRGDNAKSLLSHSIRRDASAVQDSNNNYSVFRNSLIGSLLEGAADRYYASYRRTLDSWAVDPSSSLKELRARVIAFYLPQFHPVAENDLWWGKGFTEWTNVAKARPLFKGHEQPNIPADIGFYDLRLPETRFQQAQMAKNHGVEGFCYWHYWFAGRRLLERPFQEVLSTGDPDFPFCLGWANETWTGVWNGEPKRVLIEQTYPGEMDDRAHFEYLLTAFKDRRYITVDGKPLLVIYKPLNVPDAKKRFDFWRGLACEAGLKGLHIIGTNMLDFDDADRLGLDGAMISTLGVISSSNQLINKTKRVAWGVQRRLSIGGPRVIQYQEAIKHLVPDLTKFKFPTYPTVFPNWDHTPRMGTKGVVLQNSTPELFETHMRNAIEVVSNRTEEHRIVFLKSWNEWAEGNYMEPDRKWGRAYLEALKRALTTR